MIAARPKLDRTLDPRTVIIFLLLLAGGLLDVALVIATIALSLAEKSGLAIVTGLLAAAIASTLARWSYRARRS